MALRDWWRHQIIYKYAWTSSLYQYINRKPELQMQNVFFLLQTTWLHGSLEGLNGSLSDGKLWPATVKVGIHPQISVLGSKILTIFCFLSHNFRSRYASKSIKGFKDSFSSQESKRTMSEKNFTLARGPGPDKFGLKLPKHALIVT